MSQDTALIFLTTLLVGSIAAMVKEWKSCGICYTISALSMVATFALR